MLNPIVLTGDCGDEDLGAPEVEDPFSVRDSIAHSPLPREILRAVRRHRRLGPQSASEPIVLRDPLRVLTRAFARLSLSLVRREGR